MSTSQNDSPHHYFSGFGHMSHPDDPIYPCCDKRPDDPIHVPRVPARTCECPRFRFHHLWSEGCPT